MINRAGKKSIPEASKGKYYLDMLRGFDDQFIFQSMGDFVDQRRLAWERLERYIRRLLARNGLSRDEMRDFAQLYRRATSDLALARAEPTDPRVVLYLNQLVGRAHGLIYRSHGTGFYRIVDFYRYAFPRACVRAWPYALTASAIFLVAASMSFLVTYADENFSAIVAPGLRGQVLARQNWTETIAKFSAMASSGIMTNNISVTFLAFASGITAGIGTVAILTLNGLMLGSVISLCVKHRFVPILIFVAAHGVLELSAIFIAGGAGLMIGRALIAPGSLSRRDALVDQSRVAVQLVIGCIPLLIAAGLIEGFLSPAPISPLIKIAVAVLSAVALYLYLKPSREESAATPHD